MEQVIEDLQRKLALAKLVGLAPAFRCVVDQLPATAASDAAVLLQGETGTGKELFARALHYLSGRAGFPFVPVNCGSLPDTLLEAELFGHERGAFTDARERRGGLVAEAEKGTLFLDEIDSLTGKAQACLLCFLQDKSFRPVGSTGEQQADVRIVAASNAPLQRRVEAGAFRADLYYRLGVFTLHLPPLRERVEDIPSLACHFLQKHTPPGKPVPHLAATALSALLAYRWPGNVRELENVILRSIHLSRTPGIEVEDLGLPPSPAAAAGDPRQNDRPHSYKGMKQQALNAFEKEYLLRLMHSHAGNITHAAQAAGKERRSLGKLLKKHGINPHAFRPTSPSTSAAAGTPA
jgi:transcriptional regulator with PAS, ATPase and Fis domain